MIWEEKIDLIVKKHGPDGFKDPFTFWPDILKNIEQSFIIKTNNQYPFSDWEDNIKRRKEQATIKITALDPALSLLDSTTNFWAVIVLGDQPTAKHIVYDCKLAAIKDVIGINQYNFYIVDKKYTWLLYFQYGIAKREITIFKSDVSITPLDTIV